jgi:hypothetical protein
VHLAGDCNVLAKPQLGCGDAALSSMNPATKSLCDCWGQA